MSSTYRHFKVIATCNPLCGDSNCGYIAVYRTNAKINPDQSQPFEYYLDRYDIDISHYTWNYYVMMIDGIKMETDENLFPLEQSKTSQDFLSHYYDAKAATITHNYTSYT